MHDPLGPIQDAELRLREQFTELSRLWRSVREDWTDDRARVFEQQHLAELGPSLNRLDAAISEFVQTVRRAERALQDAEGQGPREGGRNR